MPKSPDVLNEEIIVAVSLMKHATTQVLHKELLSHYSIGGIAKGLSRLAKEGFLNVEKIKNAAGKWTHVYSRTDKEYTYSSPNVVKAPALPHTELQAPEWHGTLTPKYVGAAFLKKSKKAEDPSQPDYWLSRLDEVIRGLTELKEAIPVVLAALLDISRDLERLEKVKEMINGIKGIVKRNI